MDGVVQSPHCSLGPAHAEASPHAGCAGHVLFLNGILQRWFSLWKKLKQQAADPHAHPLTLCLADSQRGPQMNAPQGGAPTQSAQGDSGCPRPGGG